MPFRLTKQETIQQFQYKKKRESGEQTTKLVEKFEEKKDFDSQHMLPDAKFFYA